MMRRMFKVVLPLSLFTAFIAVGAQAQVKVDVTKNGETTHCPCKDEKKPVTNKPPVARVAPQPAPEPVQVAVTVNIQAPPPAPVQDQQMINRPQIGDNRVAAGIGELVDLQRRTLANGQETNRLLTANNGLQAQEVGFLQKGNELQAKTNGKLTVLEWTTGLTAAGEWANFGVNLHNGMVLGSMQKGIQDIKDTVKQPVQAETFNVQANNGGVNSTITGGNNTANGFGGEGGKSSASSNSYGSTLTSYGSTATNNTSVDASSSQSQSATGTTPPAAPPSDQGGGGKQGW